MFCWYNWGDFNHSSRVNTGLDKCYPAKWSNLRDYALSNLDRDKRPWVLRDALLCFHEYLALPVFSKELWKTPIKLLLLTFYTPTHRYRGGRWRMWRNRRWFTLSGKSRLKIRYHRMWRRIVYKRRKLVVLIGRRYRKVRIRRGRLIIRSTRRITRRRKGYTRRGKWSRLGRKGFAKRARSLRRLRRLRRLRKRRRRRQRLRRRVRRRKIRRRKRRYRRRRRRARRRKRRRRRRRRRKRRIRRRIRRSVMRIYYARRWRMIYRRGTRLIFRIGRRQCFVR